MLTVHDVYYEHYVFYFDDVEVAVVIVMMKKSIMKTTFVTVRNKTMNDAGGYDVHKFPIVNICGH